MSIEYSPVQVAKVVEYLWQADPSRSRETIHAMIVAAMKEGKQNAASIGRSICVRPGCVVFTSRNMEVYSATVLVDMIHGLECCDVVALLDESEVF